LFNLPTGGIAKLYGLLCITFPFFKQAFALLAGRFFLSTPMFRTLTYLGSYYDAGSLVSSDIQIVLSGGGSLQSPWGTAMWSCTLHRNLLHQIKFYLWSSHIPAKGGGCARSSVLIVMKSATILDGILNAPNTSHHVCRFDFLLLHTS